MVTTNPTTYGYVDFGQNKKRQTVLIREGNLD